MLPTAQTPLQPPPSPSSPAHDFHLVGLKANSIWSFSLLLSFLKKEVFHYITKICIFKKSPFKNPAIIWNILIKKLNMRKRNIKPTVRREVQRQQNNGRSLRSPTTTAWFAVDDGTDTHQSHRAVSAPGNLLFSGVTVVKRKEIAIWGKMPSWSR